MSHDRHTAEPALGDFTATATRKLPRSFYWGAAVALLLHAGLIYYLVQQTFNQTPPPEAPEGPAILIDNTPPEPPQPKPQTNEKPVNHVAVHTPLDPVVTTPDTTPLTPNNVTTITTTGRRP